jgi:hypothetical protein
MTEIFDAPTRERLAKSTFDAPKRDRETDRKAYRVLSILQHILQRGEIDPEHYQAGAKFSKHYHGSLGIDVRNGDGGGNPDVEDARTYHAQMIAKVRSQLTPSEYQIIVKLISEESTPLTVGFGLSSYTRKDSARPYGAAVIKCALDHLAYIWGMKQRPK